MTDNCVICGSDPYQYYRLACRHKICPTCIDKYISTYGTVFGDHIPIHSPVTYTCYKCEKKSDLEAEKCIIYTKLDKPEDPLDPPHILMTFTFVVVVCLLIIFCYV
jgi:hypothetical protein